MCHCYADLHPFHCEEEEGVDLVPVNCLKKARPSSPLKRPMLTLLSRKMPKPATSTLRSTTATSKTSEHSKLLTAQKNSALATVSLVLVIVALAAIMTLILKSYCENQKEAKKKKVSSVSTSEVSVVSTTTSLETAPTELT